MKVHGRPRFYKIELYLTTTTMNECNMYLSQNRLPIWQTMSSTKLLILTFSLSSHIFFLYFPMCPYQAQTFLSNSCGVRKESVSSFSSRPQCLPVFMDPLTNSVTFRVVLDDSSQEARPKIVGDRTGQPLGGFHRATISRSHA